MPPGPSPRQIKHGGGQAHALKADVSDSHQVEALFKQIDKSHGGRLDILVNNAGVYLPASLADSTEADFDKTFDVNVKSMFLVTKQALDRIPDGGRVINIGSIVGERVPFAGASVYAASKFAVAGFTRAWARELAPRQITVNDVQPGPDRHRHEPGRRRQEPRGRLPARAPFPWGGTGRPTRSPRWSPSLHLRRPRSSRVPRSTSTAA